MISDWKLISIDFNATLKDALKVIDVSANRLVLVIDSNDKLLGTLSDGDIRRALINGQSLSSEIYLVMNRSPKVIYSNQIELDPVRIMNEHDLLVIPVVEKDYRLIGYYSHKEFIKKPKYDNWVFIMAGGFGKRLIPYTNDCPKPLLKVGKKPIIQTILESLIKHGFHKFYVSVHYKAEMVKEFLGDGSQWNVHIHYIEEVSPLGTGGALGLIPNVDNLPLLMMNGDLLTKVNFSDLLNFHTSEAADITMCVREYDFQVPYGVVETNGSKITSIIEKPVHSFYVNAGIYVINPKIVSTVSGDSYLDMPNLIQNVIISNGDVSCFPIHEYWLDIGNPDDYHKAQNVLF